MDFTQPQPIGARFSQLHDRPVGYDHNFVLNGGGKGLALAARVYEPRERARHGSATPPSRAFSSTPPTSLTAR